MSRIVFELKPLAWRIEDGRLVTQGINHHYVLDEVDGLYRVSWHDQVNDSHGSREFKGALEAMTWTQEKHYPAQIVPWVKILHKE